MTQNVHYTQARHLRVKSLSELVLGHEFLLCHVPSGSNTLDPLYGRPSKPFYEQKKITAAAFLSPNDEKDLEGHSRYDYRGSDDRAWRFTTEEHPYDKGNYARWRFFADYDMEPATWVRSNFVLDIDQLAERGIHILRNLPAPRPALKPLTGNEPIVVEINVYL